MSEVQKIAQFFSISEAQWLASQGESQWHAGIRLPERATVGSAGYDFFAPYGFEIQPGERKLIYSGIRAEIAEGWVLLLSPRSSAGIKFGIQFANIFPVIDRDYFYADNEGHIMLKLVNTGDKPWRVEAGDRICQGIFVPFGITVDDAVVAKRSGGVGSTGK